MKLSPQISQALENLKIDALNSMQEASIDAWILDVSKFEAGYVNFKYEQFNISALFQEIYDTFQKKIKPDVLFLCDLKNSECVVEFDKNRTAQIINNFITNSNKYTKELCRYIIWKRGS